MVSGDWDRLTTLGMFLGNDFADGASVVFELLFIFPRKCGKSSFFLSEPHQPILKCWKKLERNTEKKWQLIFFNSREINQGNFHFCFAHLSPLICKGVNSSYQFNHLHKRSTEDPHSFSMFTVVYSCRKYLKAACSLEPTMSYSNISNVKEWNKDSLWIFFVLNSASNNFQSFEKYYFVCVV